jgi:hypothetical protein
MYECKGKNTLQFYSASNFRGAKHASFALKSNYYVINYNHIYFNVKVWYMIYGV